MNMVDLNICKLSPCFFWNAWPRWCCASQGSNLGWFNHRFYAVWLPEDSPNLRERSHFLLIWSWFSTNPRPSSHIQQIVSVFFQVHRRQSPIEARFSPKKWCEHRITSSHVWYGQVTTTFGLLKELLQLQLLFIPWDRSLAKGNQIWVWTDSLRKMNMKIGENKTNWYSDNVTTWW